MNWREIYPTVSAVNQANNETLFAWEKELPPPQTDVERTVHRRIKRRCLAIAEEALRDADPELADTFAELMDLTSRLLGKDVRDL